MAQYIILSSEISVYRKSVKVAFAHAKRYDIFTVNKRSILFLTDYYFGLHPLIPNPPQNFKTSNNTLSDGFNLLDKTIKKVYVFSKKKITLGYIVMHSNTKSDISISFINCMK